MPLDTNSKKNIKLILSNLNSADIFFINIAEDTLSIIYKALTFSESLKLNDQLFKKTLKNCFSFEKIKELKKNISDPNIISEIDRLLDSPADYMDKIFFSLRKSIDLTYSYKKRL